MSPTERADPPETVERPPSARQSRAKIALAALLFLIVLPAWLRFTGIGFLLPHHPEPDGGVIVYQTEVLEGRIPHGEDHIYWGYYPHLLARLATLWPERWIEAEPGRTLTLDEHLQRAAAPWRRVRETIAVVALLAVPGTLLLALVFPCGGYGLIAPLLMATSFLGVWFAQQARPHAAATSVFLFAVLAAVRLRRRGAVFDYVLAGALAGFALACLQSGVFVLPALVAAVALRERRPGGASPLWAIAALALAAAIAWCFYPTAAGGAGAAQGAPLVAYDGVKNVLYLKGHMVMIGSFNGHGALGVARALWEYEPWIGGLALLGLVRAGWRLARRVPVVDPARRRDLWVVLAFVLPYLVSLLLYERTYQRFMLPLVPYACVLAAYAVQGVTQWIVRRARAVEGPVEEGEPVGTLVFVSLFAVLGLATLPPILLALRLVEVRSKPDTLTQAARWIEEHVAPDERVLVMPGLDVPLAASEAARRAGAEFLAPRGRPWTDYQNAMPERELPGPLHDLRSMPIRDKADLDRIGTDAPAFVNSLGGAFALVEVYEQPWRTPVLQTIYDAVRLNGDRVASFAPDAEGNGRGMPLAYQDDQQPFDTHWARRTLSAERTGPVLELYRLR